MQPPLSNWREAAFGVILLSRFRLAAVWTLLLVLLPVLAAAEKANNKLLTGEELSKFLGPVSPDAIKWTRSGGVDFVLYHGIAQPPLAGEVGFYLGGHPDFRTGPGSTTVKGHLGIFPAKWHRRIEPNKSVTQNALVHLDYYWQVDIGVNAPRQEDVDKLVAVVSQLPTFTKKPDPIPGFPNTALEFYAMPISGIFTFVILVGSFTLGGRLLNRRWHEKRATRARRNFILAAYAGGSSWSVPR